MQKRPLLVAALLAGCASLALSQARPVLGILPFTGGTGGDGEAIATLLSIEPGILDAFTVVPRTAALNAIFAEHYFQLAGLTDSDTIAGIGRMLNADYVLSGNIRRLGDRNLVIATIVNVESFEQVAGYHRTYGSIEEVVGFLASMSRTMVDATLGRETDALPSLAMLPFTLAPGIDEQDAETLSMILAIEILNTGGFVVLPRTSTIQAALGEMDFQLLGYTEDAGMAALGRAINADLVLSGGVHRLGALNMFTAQVLRVADGSVVLGASRNYQVIADGVDIMPELAALLAGTEAAAGPAISVVPQPAPAPRERVRRERAPREGPQLPALQDPTRFWSVGLSMGTLFADSYFLVTLQTTIAPWSNWFIRIGCDVSSWGRWSEDEKVRDFAVIPFVHFVYFLPFARRGGWYMGGGFSITMGRYSWYDGWNTHTINRTIVALDFTLGVNLGDRWDISYTLQTPFSTAFHRISIGRTWRIQQRSE